MPSEPLYNNYGKLIGSNVDWSPQANGSNSSTNSPNVDKISRDTVSSTNSSSNASSPEPVEPLDDSSPDNDANRLYKESPEHRARLFEKYREYADKHILPASRAENVKYRNQLKSGYFNDILDALVDTMADAQGRTDYQRYQAENNPLITGNYDRIPDWALRIGANLKRAKDEL